MKLYIIDNWLQEVDRALPRADWATTFIKRFLAIDAIGKRDNGKPYIVGKQQFINWSHNERYLVIALSDIGEIGVDIEDAQIAYAEHLYSWVLHDEEKRRLAAGVTFAEIWTRKEAVLKWTGEGLSESLHELNSYAVDATVVSFIMKEICISICSAQREMIDVYDGYRNERAFTVYCL